MTKDDKLAIYNLLKTASGNFYGYTTKYFAGDVLEFSDDAEVAFDTGFADSEKNSFAGNRDFSASENSAYAVTSSASENSFDANENFSAVKNTHGISENFANKEISNGEQIISIATSQIPPLKSLPAIAAKIAECNSCPLCQTRTNTVPGMGVANPLVLVVGEGPGHDEDISGLPFVGAAGKLLDKMLIAIQLDRNKNCYIANVVKCRPPNNRTPTHEEAAACGGFLRAQIDVLKPKMILAAGRTAAHYLLETDAPLGTLRGTFYNYHTAYGDVPLLVTYHPSALLRDESNKRPAWEDLKMFKSRLLEIAPNYAN